MLGAAQSMQDTGQPVSGQLACIVEKIEQGSLDLAGWTINSSWLGILAGWTVSPIFGQGVNCSRPSEIYLRQVHDEKTLVQKASCRT